MGETSETHAMKAIIPVPFIFSAPVGRNGTPKAVLHFCFEEFEIREVSEAEAPVAVRSVRTRPEVTRVYRLHEGNLYAGYYRHGRAPAATPAVIPSQVAREVAKEALSVLSRVRVADCHPRSGRDLLKAFIEGRDTGNRPGQDATEAYMAAAEAMAGDRRVAAFAETEGFRRAREEWTAKTARAFERLLWVDGFRYERSRGPAVAVSVVGSEVRVNDQDDILVGGSPFDGYGSFGELRGKKPRVSVWHFPPSERDEAIRFAEGMAEDRGLTVVLSDREVEYRIDRDELPVRDIHRMELERAARLLAIAVGGEITRRIRNRDHSYFEDDPSIRHACDTLVHAVRGIEGGSDGGGLDDALDGLLEALRSDPEAANAMYRNVLDTHAGVIALADHALGRWYDRPLRIGLEGDGPSPM